MKCKPPGRLDITTDGTSWELKPLKDKWELIWEERNCPRPFLPSLLASPPISIPEITGTNATPSRKSEIKLTADLAGLSELAKP